MIAATARSIKPASPAKRIPLVNGDGDGFIITTTPEMIRRNAMMPRRRYPFRVTAI
jgi:hypothetical protein